MSLLDKLSPYALAFKIGAAALIAAAFFAVFAVNMRQGQEIARLTEWQNTVLTSATDATVQPDAKGVRKTLKPEQVPAAIAALKRGLDGYVGQMAALTQTTEDAKLRAENADAALAKATVVFEQRYQSAEKRIAALDSRPPATDPAKACLQMQADSRAAWEGWK